MKWSKVWVVAPLVAGLALACGSDVAEEDIVGTWNATDFVFSNFEDPVVDFDVIDAGGDITIILRADGTYTITSVFLDLDDDGDWVLNGDVLTFDDGTVDESAFDVSLDGNTLTIHGEDLEFDFGDGDEPAQLDATFVRQ